MSYENDDGELGRAFEDLRRETAARAPDFTEMMAEARERAAEMPQLGVVNGGGDADAREADVRDSREDPRRRMARFGGWVSLAAAAGAAGLLFLQQGVDPADAEFEALVAAYSADAASGAWSSPTDALLDIPGLDLGSVPSFGGAVRGTDADNVQGREP